MNPIIVNKEPGNGSLFPICDFNIAIFMVPVLVLLIPTSFFVLEPGPLKLLYYSLVVIKTTSSVWKRNISIWN